MSLTHGLLGTAQFTFKGCYRVTKGFINYDCGYLRYALEVVILTPYKN